MFDWFMSLFDTAGFVPRKECGSWTPGWIALHSGSDVLIWMAYVSIPLVLLFGLRGRSTSGFRLPVVLFALFILACGFTHLVESLMFEYPVYRLSGVMKAVTAVVSWVTVFAIVPVVPKVLARLTPTGPDQPDEGLTGRDKWQLYLFAVLVACLGVFIRHILSPLLGGLHPFAISVLAVILVSWYGGFLPGAVCTVVSCALAAVLFLEPQWADPAIRMSNQFDISFFLFTGLGVSVLGQLQRTARVRMLDQMAAVRQAADALAAEKQATDRALTQLDALVRNAPHGIAFFDERLRYLRVNETYARANGLAVENHFGRHLHEVRPSDPTLLIAEFEQVLLGGPPLNSRPVVGPDHVWEVSAFQVPIDQDRMGLAVIGQDVTERHRAAERLRESESRFRQLTEVMPQVVWVARADGYREYFNSRWYDLTGLSEEQSLGHNNWTAALHPDDLERGRAAWAKAVETGEVYQIEYRFRRTDGQYLWYLGRALPVRDAAGQITRWLGTCTEIDEKKRQEIELHEARRFAESVVHSLSSHLVVTDEVGQIITVNESWRQFGEANGVPPGYDWTTDNYYRAALADKSYGAKAVSGIRAVASGERGGFEMEYPCHGTGQERYFNMRVNRFRGDGPVRLVITHENITLRVLAERQVRETASQLVQLTEGMPMLMWACQPSGECDYLSRQWLEYTGLGLDQQLGYGWLDSLHPDDREQTAAAWQSAVADDTGYDVEFRIRRHDGAYRWFAVRGIPMRDQAGKIIRWYGSCTDIDDRVHQESVLERLVEERSLALQQQQVFLNAILDNVAEGIVACDTEGRLQLFNAATRRMHGLPAESLPPERWAEYYQLFEADGQTPMSTQRIPLLRAWRGEEVRDAELVIRAIGQPERYVVCSGHQLRASDGRLFGAVVSMRDMTERREYERQLIQTAASLKTSNEELEKFAYIASHDLQEPLRKIQAFGTRLADKFRDAIGAQGKDYIDRMLDSAGRMRRLIEDLLTFSRVTTKAATFVPVDLNVVVRDVLSDLDDRVARSAGKVEVGELPTLPGDTSQLRQLFQNLIGNALKFARPDRPPVVVVSATEFAHLPPDAPPPPPGAGWRISVSDNGIGFEQEYAERIFELFQRLHGREEYEGTGLGLAIVRKIVLRHGGVITAHGRPNEGAEFRIDWPVRTSPHPNPPR